MDMTFSFRNMKNWLKLLIYSFREWGILGFIQKPWAFRRGFTKEMVSLCKITSKNHCEFISDWEHNNRWPFNKPYQGAVSDKLGLVRILHEYKECMPEYYFFIDQYGLLPLWDCPNKDSIFAYRVDASAFIKLLDLKKILVIKPTHSEVGWGVMIAKRTTNGYSLNGKDCNVEELKSKISKAYNNIVTEYIIQHEYSRKICDTSLNTIRMLGVWNSETCQFEIIRCFHRFGCNGNVVDNVGSGNGLLVYVDIETGILEDIGLINENHKGDRVAHHIVHPDSHISLTGLQIPYFQEMKAKVLKILNENSYLRYVGFDVAITEDGFKIIEANGSSTPSAAQVKGGFLKDKRMVDLFNSIKPL